MDAKKGAKMADSLVPVHLGLIIDGNRRWAKQKGLSKLEGHKKGYQNLRDIACYGFKKGAKYISAFIFSTENWKRDKEEVAYLMDLALWIAKNEIEQLHKENIRVRFLGSKDKISVKLLNAIRKAEVKTKDNTRGMLALCFNYGGRQELAEAYRAMIRDGVKENEVNPKKIEQYLYASDIPEIDLVIRTSGEQRLSNFMLWRSAYAELIFVDKYWPDFSEQDIDYALMEYTKRQRRFGV